MGFKSFHHAAAAATLFLGALALPGCGGGGGGSSVSTTPTTPGGPGQVQTFGALTAHIVGTAQPPVVGGSGPTTVTGVGGATITALQAIQPATLASTLIAFDRGGEVYTMSPDGPNVTQVTKDIPGPADLTRPSWGAGGSKIAYERYDASVGHIQIYIMLADGTGAYRLTDGTSECGSPAISPNGSTVLFQEYNNAVGAFQIYSISSTGGTAIRLGASPYPQYNPAWSPDGSKYAYTQFDGTGVHYQVYIANANGSGAHLGTPQLPDLDCTQPAWSPDGSKIAISGHGGANSHIYAVSANGSAVAQTLTSAAFNDSFPVWSPDGAKIAFSRTDASNNSQIYVANADGTQAIRITDGATADTAPAWSPLITKRYYVGPGYPMGTTAAGFLCAQQGDVITSLITYNATTPSGTAIASLPGTSPNLQNIIFTISSTDAITSLIYVSGLSARAVAAIGPGSSVSTATNAVVSYNAETGRVSTVLPYTASHIVTGGAAPGALRSHAASGAIVIEGKFLAAMDADGHNKAPGGATEVRLDAHTGAILSVQ